MGYFDVYTWADLACLLRQDMCDNDWGDNSRSVDYFFKNDVDKNNLLAHSAYNWTESQNTER